MVGGRGETRQSVTTNFHLTIVDEGREGRKKRQERSLKLLSAAALSFSPFIWTEEKRVYEMRRAQR